MRRSQSSDTPNPTTPNPATLQAVPLAAIKRDRELMCREHLSEETVDEYAAALEAGAEFPPAELFHDAEGNYWVGDGHHRIEAHAKLERPEVQANVRPGTRDDALLFAARANSQHGLRRTNKDKQIAVRRVLEVNERGKHEWSDTVVAEKCGVSDRMVAGVRQSLAPTPKVSGLNVRKGKDGKSRRVPKAKKAKLDKSGLLRDWRKLAAVRRKFRELGDRWREQRPDLAGGFDAVVTAIGELDKLMAAKPASKPATEPAAPTPAPVNARRRIVHAVGNGGAS